MAYLRTNLMPIDNATKWVIAEYARHFSMKGFKCYIVSTGRGGYRRIVAGNTHLPVYEVPKSLFILPRLYKFLSWHSSSELLESIPIAYYAQKSFGRIPILELLGELINDIDVIISHDLESAMLLNNSGRPLIYLAHDIFGSSALYEEYFYRKLLLSVEYKTINKTLLATLSYYDKLQFESLYKVHASYLGLGPINYLSYNHIKWEGSIDVELPDKYILIFSTKGLERRIFIPSEKRYAQQNLFLIKTLAKNNYPVVVIGKESRVLVKLLQHYTSIRNIVALGYVDYRKYINVLQNAYVTVLPLFGWRSGVSIKLLDALSYSNVVVTSYDAARAFPRLSGAPFIARDFKELIEKVKRCFNEKTAWLHYNEWLNNYKRQYLSWNKVIDRFKNIFE